MIRNHADHSANERTFLAWVRTVIAVVGFGLAVAHLSDTPPPGWTGPALLGLGAVVIALAWLRTRAIARAIESDRQMRDGEARADALLAVLVAALFGLLALFALHVS